MTRRELAEQLLVAGPVAQDLMLARAAQKQDQHVRDAVKRAHEIATKVMEELDKLDRKLP